MNGRITCPKPNLYDQEISLMCSSSCQTQPHAANRESFGNCCSTSTGSRPGCRLVPAVEIVEKRVDADYPAPQRREGKVGGCWVQRGLGLGYKTRRLRA